MAMLLTSNGPTTDLLRATLQDLLGTPFAEARLVVVIDAILPFAGDKSKLLENLGVLHDMGWAEFDVLSLSAGPRHLVAERLRSADVVLGYGGSNIWQAHVWQQTGLTDVLQEIVEQKVYVGWSAGSMIFSQLHAAASVALEDDEPEVFEVADVRPALPLFDWFVLCHLGADYLPDHGDDRALRTAPLFGGPVWFLDDESALLLRDPSSDPEIVSSGHWLRFDAEGQLADSR